MVLFIIFIHVFLAVLGLRCCWGFSLVVASRSYSLVAMHGILIEAASHCRAQVLDTRASVTGACGLCSCGSPALENRLNSCGERT